MLETLDDAIFADLEDAYGPAVDVAPRLRVIATSELDEARAAIGDLAAGIFHQGSYYPSAAPAVPFLVEIAGADVPARADVLLFLAHISGAPSPAHAYDPYPFRSTPAPPDYYYSITCAMRRAEPVSGSPDSKAGRGRWRAKGRAAAGDEMRGR